MLNKMREENYSVDDSAKPSKYPEAVTTQRESGHLRSELRRMKSSFLR